MNNLTMQGLNLLEKKFNMKLFLDLINKSWYLKKKLSNRISSKKIDKFYNNCINNGAIGGKLLGAGGGGFLLLFFSRKSKKKLTKFIKKSFFFQCMPAQSGSKIIYHSK
jgi:D-glycero-alpha-D-manno-heptose-7-phosphate kinase